MSKMTINLFLILGILFTASIRVSADGDMDPPLPTGISSLRLDDTLSVSGLGGRKLARSLVGVKGSRQVVVRLEEQSVVEIYKEQIDNNEIDFGEQSAQLATLKKSQDHILSVAFKLDENMKVLGSLQRIMNAVLLEINAAALDDLAADPDVEAIIPLIDYELDLSETVPYIGASEVNSLGYTGEGVTVAVMDTGIDYTHAAFGGSGSTQDYTSNDPSFIEAGTFPTEKVIGGYDFVGGAWPLGDLMPDPDPLDAGPGRGHGTHVAHIIGGISMPEYGIAGGVAPGVNLLAIKVCSSVTPDCSGVALLRGMDLAVDPNGDGELDDAVNIINISLGKAYGNAAYDALSLAVDQASSIGVLTVTAAGNGGDKPYVHSAPAEADTALSVGATYVPSTLVPLMEVTTSNEEINFYTAFWQSWSAELKDVYPDGIKAPIVYGDGLGGNLDGCVQFKTETLQNSIVLVDRGNCSFSDKIMNIESAGGLAGIVGMNKSGDPFDTAPEGDDHPNIPAYLITKDAMKEIVDELPDVSLKLEPSMNVSLMKRMTAYSSRGPSSKSKIIKPEIGAPDASVSAVAGSGTEMSAFGGTSGASPMVSGSAALLMEAFRTELASRFPENPAIIKSILVTNADPNIQNSSQFENDELAPITRIGGGEVRVDYALKTSVALWVNDTDGKNLPDLSFGEIDATRKTTVLSKFVTVHNLTDRWQYFDLSASFRYPQDEENGAVKIEIFPSEVEVPPAVLGDQPEAHFIVQMTINGEKLKDWSMNSGSQGANGQALTNNEFDGYIWLDDKSTSDDDDRMIHLPWQVLPRLSGDVQASSDVVIINSEVNGIPAGKVDLSNNGVGPGYIDAYSWVAHSPEIPAGNSATVQRPLVDIKDVGVVTYPVPEGYCSDKESFVMAVAITTYDRYPHAVPNPSFHILMDTDQDGLFDFDIFNFDLSLSDERSDGRSVTWVKDLRSGETNADFYLDHGTNSSNFVLLFCGDQIGLDASDYYYPLEMRVLASDGYYLDLVTDQTEVIPIAPLGERFEAEGKDVNPFTTETWTVFDYGTGNATEMGILLLLDAARDGGVRGGSPVMNESITLTVFSP